MTKLNFNKVVLGLACAAVLAATWPTLTIGQITSVTTAGQPLVAATDLTAVGYHHTVVQVPNGQRFLPPVFYFKVDEKIANKNNAPDIVAVLVRTKPTSDWVFNNGQPQQRELDGKFQTRQSTNNYYIVVTGPDGIKVSALVAALAKKYN